MSAFNRLLVGWIAKYPWRALAIGMLVVAALTPGLSRLKTDFTHTGFFNLNDPKLKKFEDFERRFGSDDMVIIAVHSPSGVFDVPTARLVREITEKMWRVPEVLRVESFTNYNWLRGREGEIVVEPFLPTDLTDEVLAERREVARADRVLPRYLVSPDLQTTVIAGRVKPALDHPPDSRAITLALRKIVSEVKPSDEVLHIFGQSVVTYAFEEVTLKDLVRLVPLALGISAIFMFLLLRSFVGILLPFVTVIGTMLASFGMAGWFGLVQVPLSTAIPSILIAVGIADTVHILVSFFRARREGDSQYDAARYALSRNLLPTFLTCLTTSVGFFSFVGANLKPLSMLGIVTGFGSAVNWLLTYLLTGAALFVVPIHVKPLTPGREDLAHVRSRRLVDFVTRRRGAIILGSFVISGLCFWYSLSMDVSTDPIKYFSRELPVRQAHEAMARDMGAARSIELVIETGREGGVQDPAFLRKVEALEAEIKKDPNVTDVVSIVDTLKQINQALNDGDPKKYELPGDEAQVAQQLLLYTLALPPGTDLNDRITTREDALRVTLLGNHENSREAVELVDRTQALGRKLGLPSITATGKYYLYQETSNYVVQSLLSSTASATLVIGIIMGLMLKSIRLGIVSMIPNLLPLFVGAAMLRFLNRPLDLGTAMVASVSLGISIDDTSQVLANFARAREQGLAAKEALYSVMEHALPSLLSTNGILIASFASFAVATYIPNVVFGLLTAFVFVVALIADLLLTPAMLLPLARSR